MLYPLSYGRALDDSDEFRDLNSLFAVGSGYTGLWAGGSRDRGNFSILRGGARLDVVIGVERCVMRHATFNQERKNGIQNSFSRVG